MGYEGLQRLEISNLATYFGEPPAVVSSQVVDDVEFKEHLIPGEDEDGNEDNSLVVIAPHGGDIEEWTNNQAIAMAGDSQLTTTTKACWWCEGTGDGTGGNAFVRWHITSTDISEHSFPKLKQIIDRRFAHAVSFHGFGHSSLGDVLIGGGANDALKVQIKQAIDTILDDEIEARIEAGYPVVNKPKVVAPAPSPYTGNEKRNIVNRLAAAGKGIQIEQSWPARQHWGQTIAMAVASVYANLPGV